MAGTTIGTAYVQILPSAQGIQGQLTKVLGGEVENAGKGLAGKLGGGLIGGLKTVGVAAGAALAAGIGSAVAIGKQSLNNFKEEFMKKLSGKGINLVSITKLSSSTGYQVKIPYIKYDSTEATKYLTITYKYDSKTRNVF